MEYYDSDSDLDFLPSEREEEIEGKLSEGSDDEFDD